MKLKPFIQAVKVENLLFIRGFYGFFFTFLFPPLMLVLFGSLYGNEPSALFGGRGSMDVSVPSYIGMVVAVVGLMGLPLTMGEYKTSKIYKVFDATPVGKSVIIAAQFFLHFIMTILGTILLLIVGKVLYNVQIAGDFFAIAGALLLSMAAMFALGFCIAAVLPSAKTINLVSYILYFLMLFASGATLPVELFPDTMRKIIQVLPLTHVVNLLKGTFAGRPIADYWVNIVVLAGCVVVFGGIGIISFKKKRWT